MSRFVKSTACLLFALLIAALLHGAAAARVEYTRANLYQMGEQHLSASMSLLLEKLGAADRHTRRIAAHALGKIGDARALEPLIGLARDHQEEVLVRASAARALGRLGQDAALPTLKKLCQGDCHRLIQNAAADSLARLKVASVKVAAQTRP